MRPAKCNTLDFLQSPCALGGLDLGQAQSQTQSQAEEKQRSK